MRLQPRRRRPSSTSANVGNEWQSRPLLGRVLRCAIFVAPIGGSLLIALGISRLLPRASSWQNGLLLTGVVAATSIATLVLFEKLARKLVPLAALLNLSLVFPDKAPARFAMARQVGSPRDLQERLRKARVHGDSGDASALQSVIELVLALSVHDKATRGHSERVRVFTDLIAAELGLDQVAKGKLRWAALLHDIGKLDVPSEILNKPGAPDHEEWRVLHQHPENGARLAAPLLPWLGDWGRAVAEHHERFDGTGYPRGLKGQEISLAARIVAVADTYEVMTAPRPYKRSMSVTAARRELTRVAGTQLDPAIVRAFLNVSLGRLWRTIGVGAWLGQLPTLSRFFNGLGSFGSWLAPGVATISAAGIVAVSGFGFAGPLPHPASAARSGSLPAQAEQGSSGGDGGGPSAQGQLPGAAGTATADPTSHSSGGGGGGGTERSPATPTSQGNTRSTPTPAPPPPSSTPQATPTPSATPAPTPDPTNCDHCTNTSSSCTSDCNNNNLPNCTDFCEGNNNSACLHSCFGNNNSKCLSYCYGSNNSHCQEYCYKNTPAAAGVPSASPTARASP